MEARPTTGDRYERQRSFERLYLRHHGELFRFLLRDLRNREDAEDVAQTAFANAYRAYVEGEPPAEPRAWLFAIARNANRRRFRRAAVAEVPLEEGAAAAATPVVPAVEEIRQALAALPFNQRSALLLRELAGLSYDEIARELDVTPAAVQMLVFRARRGLRRALEPDRFARVRALAAIPLARLSSLFDSTGSSGGVTAAARAAGVVGAVVVASGIVAGTGAVPLPGPGGGDAPDARAAPAPEPPLPPVPGRAAVGPGAAAVGSARPSRSTGSVGAALRSRRGPRARAGDVVSASASGGASSGGSVGPRSGAAPPPPAAVGVAVPRVSLPRVHRPATPRVKPTLPPAPLPALPKPPAVEAVSPPALPAPIPPVTVEPPKLPTVPQLP